MKETYEIEVLNIAKVVCGHYQIEVADLQSRRRFGRLVLPRQITWSLAREIYGKRITYDALGKLLGGKDHATVLSACTTIQNYCDTDGAFREKYANLLNITRDLKSPPTIADKLASVLHYTDMINIKIAIRELLTVMRPQEAN